MEKRKLKELTDNKTVEQVKEILDEFMLKGILMIPIAKQPVSKGIALAVQSTFAISKKQAYAMYMNYINCGVGSEMRAKSTLIRNGKLFIYGHCRDEVTQRNLAISMKMISKSRMISYVEI